MPEEIGQKISHLPMQTLRNHRFVCIEYLPICLIKVPVCLRIKGICKLFQLLPFLLFNKVVVLPESVPVFDEQLLFKRFGKKKFLFFRQTVWRKISFYDFSAQGKDAVRHIEEYGAVQSAPIMEVSLRIFSACFVYRTVKRYVFSALRFRRMAALGAVKTQRDPFAAVRSFGHIRISDFFAYLLLEPGQCDVGDDMDIYPQKPAP